MDKKSNSRRRFLKAGIAATAAHQFQYLQYGNRKKEYEKEYVYTPCLFLAEEPGK